MIKLIFILAILVGIAYGILFLLHLTIQRYKFTFDEEHIDLFFGLPGSGKTTLLADIVRQVLKKGHISVYTNMPIKGAYILEKEDIGKYDFRQDGDTAALLLLDEGQTVYNCRNAMSKKESLRMTEAEIKFFCMHRHYKTQVNAFSQGYEDLDKIIRNRTYHIYYVTKSRIRGFIKVRRIARIVDIENEQKQIVEGYEFERFSTRYVYGPKVWKMFDTYDCEPLPKKDAYKWYTQ